MLDDLQPKLDWLRSKLLGGLPAQLNPEQKLTLSVVAIVGGWDKKNSDDVEIVKKLLDSFSVSYDEFLKHIESIVQLESVPLELNVGRRTATDILKLVKQICHRLSDKHLDAFKECAIDVLKEIDPGLELLSAERYIAGAYGKTPKYSYTLRESIAESLATIGNIDNPAHCSSSKAKEITRSTIEEIFRNSGWKLWASLDNFLPVLAEAHPAEFIKSATNALKTTPCPFDKLFPQRDAGGITWGHYMTGLLWGLEKLAWHDEYIVQTVSVLGGLANRDLGGNHANKPIDSISTLLLPGYPQTQASISKRIECVNALQQKYPDIAWRVVLTLLSNQYQNSSGNSQPKWCNPLSENHQISVTNQEYWKQVEAYSNIAVEMANKKTERLAELASHLDNLTPEAFNKAIGALSQEKIVALEEDERLPVWNKLTDLVERHKGFSDTDRLFDEKDLTKINAVKDSLKPTSAQGMALRTFYDDHELYEEGSDLEAQIKSLGEKRIKLVRSIMDEGGIDGLISFVQKVKNPNALGQALAEIDDEQADHKIIPQMLLSESPHDRSFSHEYVYYKRSHQGWKWLEHVFSNEWSVKEKLALLRAVPADPYVWERLEAFLGEDQNQYWERVTIRPEHIDDLDLVIPKLLKAKQGIKAINCLYTKLRKGDKPDLNIVRQAFMMAVAEPQASSRMHAFRATELIKHLQSQDSFSEDALCEIECAYLPWLSKHGSEVKPKTLSKKLATNPEFFSKVIGIRYSSKNVDANSADYPEDTISKAKQLLYCWNHPPGFNDDGSFDGEKFSKWYQGVVQKCTNPKYLELAKFKIGQVFFYTPPDSDGFWTNKHVAKTLNRIDNVDLWRGFRSEIYNSLGVHQVDSTGKSEFALAQEWSKRADALDAEGMTNFATELRRVSGFYEHDAETTQSMCKQ